MNLQSVETFNLKTFYVWYRNVLNRFCCTSYMLVWIELSSHLYATVFQVIAYLLNSTKIIISNGTQYLRIHK